MRSPGPKVVALALLALFVFGTMVVEALRARINEQAQMARGGVEPAGDVYRTMQFVYPGMFAAMLFEGTLRGPAPMGLVVAGASVLAGAKFLKWAAIRALGPFWTFRVIVVPGAALVARGPYRYLRHPNYVGVVGEIVGVGLVAQAIVSGPLAVLAFGVLLARRLAVEERALGLAKAPASVE